MDRKNLIDVHIQHDIDWLAGTVDELIDKLSSIKAEQLEKDVFGLYIDEDRCYDEVEYHLFGYRKETPAEKKKRLKAEELSRAKAKIVKQKNAESRDKSERTTYERLKAKFEGNQDG